MCSWVYQVQVQIHRFSADIQLKVIICIAIIYIADVNEICMP